MRASGFVIFLALALALGFDAGVDAVGDDLLRAARLVLANARTPRAAPISACLK
jgi:hypothetical protein